MCLTYTRQAETGACERGPILFEDTDETQLYFFFFIGYKSCSDCVKLVPCLEVMMSWMMKKNKKRVQCNNRKQTRTGKTPNITADILHECVLEWENESQPEIYAARSSVDCVGARQHAEEKTFHFP
ncbi:uncharacterized protein LOC128332022 isoform X3 [Hemicordylus capensis]|uniref:uncharacterized protein LOC128332022 isoform X3 n=1 Tax=Hemicordylus capensis TaxID=884348 RepID=UPI002304AE10|nr:uncharacterized protein LOC128332022 isoform X3 [Hemicordylus capensis]